MRKSTIFMGGTGGLELVEMLIRLLAEHEAAAPDAPNGRSARHDRDARHSSTGTVTAEIESFRGTPQ
jgi:hypothetical protein